VHGGRRGLCRNKNSCMTETTICSGRTVVSPVLLWVSERSISLRQSRLNGPYCFSNVIVITLRVFMGSGPSSGTWCNVTECKPSIVAAAPITVRALSDNNMRSNSVDAAHSPPADMARRHRTLAARTRSRSGASHTTATDFHPDTRKLATVPRRSHGPQAIGLDGPNKTTTGVPVAAAICDTPVSTPTYSAARPITAASSARDTRPTRSTVSEPAPCWTAVTSALCVIWAPPLNTALSTCRE
jgi:hypothetical protein